MCATPRGRPRHGLQWVAALPHPPTPDDPHPGPAARPAQRRTRLGTGGLAAAPPVPVLQRRALAGVASERPLRAAADALEALVATGRLEEAQAIVDKMLYDDAALDTFRQTVVEHGGVAYEFLFMRADGSQLGKIAELVDTSVIRPIVDSQFAFTDTPKAMDA